MSKDRVVGAESPQTPDGVSVDASAEFIRSGRYCKLRIVSAAQCT